MAVKLPYDTCGICKKNAFFEGIWNDSLNSDTLDGKIEKVCRKSHIFCTECIDEEFRKIRAAKLDQNVFFKMTALQILNLAIEKVKKTSDYYERISQFKNISDAFLVKSKRYRNIRSNIRRN